MLEKLGEEVVGETMALAVVVKEEEVEGFGRSHPDSEGLAFLSLV